jgi:hypothetical protein
MMPLKRIKTFLVMFLVSCACVAQDTSTLKLSKLPYNKYRGLQIVWLDLTGYAVFSPSTNDGAYAIFITPKYGYYLTKKIELVAGYSFIYTKFGSLSTKKSSINHQASFTGRYYPFKKANYFFIESGVQAGNYTSEKSTGSIQRNLFSTNLLAGFGVELLPRKAKYAVNFSALFAIPFNNQFKLDFIRSLGFGIVIKK